MFLMDPAQPETDRATVKFQNWTTIGAELLITGNILTQGDLVDMELRLFDPFKGEMLIGKRYKGWQKDRQKMLRRFCSEVIYLLTGNWGFSTAKSPLFRRQRATRRSLHAILTEAGPSRSPVSSPSPCRRPGG